MKLFDTMHAKLQINGVHKSCNYSYLVLLCNIEWLNKSAVNDDFITTVYLVKYGVIKK